MTRADRFTDPVAIITGAAGGLGRATAHRFADEGARLMDMTQGAQITATLTPLVQTAESMEQQLEDYLSLLGSRGAR